MVVQKLKKHQMAGRYKRIEETLSPALKGKEKKARPGTD